MFSLLINLIVAGFLLQHQAGQQQVLGESVQLSEAEVKVLKETTPSRINKDSYGVKLTAESAISVDMETGKILYALNTDEVRSIASITKLMTALVFLDLNTGWDNIYKVREDDYQPGAYRYLYTGESHTVEDIFYAAMVSSANEAATILARATGMTPDQFVAAMNYKAKMLGMKNTHFTEPTGLSEDNVSTAEDVAILFKAALKHHKLADAISTGSYHLSPVGSDTSRRITSTNTALNTGFGLGGDLYRVAAGKTGFVDQAGYCFASQINNSYGNKIIVVVLGSQDVFERFNDTKRLAFWVYNNYKW